MAKTFRDFIIECEAYPYSQACFDLMKECSEIELTKHFLESQEYMLENHSTLFGESVSLDIGYLTESADEHTMEVMTESLKSKVGNAWAKITTGLKNLIKTLRNLFQRIAAKFDDKTKIAKLVLKKFNTKEGLGDAELERLSDLVKGDLEFAVPPQPFAKKLKCKLPPDSDLKNKIALALSTEEVIVKGQNSTNNKAPLDIRDIHDLVKSFQAGAKRGSAIKSTISNIDRCIQASVNNGIRIPCREGYLRDVAEELDGLLNEMKSDNFSSAAYKGANERDKKAQLNEEDETVLHNEDWTATNAAYTKLAACVGESSKVYLGVYNYRNKVLSGMASLVTASGGSGKKKKGDKPEEDNDSEP